MQYTCFACLRGTAVARRPERLPGNKSPARRLIDQHYLPDLVARQSHDALSAYLATNCLPDEGRSIVLHIHTLPC